MMNLLIVTAASDRSEIETYCAFVSRGYRVAMICSPHWAGEAPLVEGGVNVLKIPIRHRCDLHAAKRIRRLVDEIHPDLIYAPRNAALAVSLIATRRHKRLPVIGYRGTTGHLSRLDPASWLTYFHPRLKRIVCVSEAVRQYLLGKRIRDDVLQTIYKGHRVQWYDFGTPVNMAAFGIPNDAFVVGFAGNMRAVKGVDVLLRSLSTMAPGMNVHALLIGEVRDKRVAALAGDPRMAERAHFTGFRKDAAVLSGACDVVVMPSVEREGLPRAVIEAMAQRVPAIVTDVGGMPELVEHGVSGLVVPPRDHKALAEAMMALAGNRDKCKAMGLAARERIESTFNVNTTIEKMSALFESAL